MHLGQNFVSPPNEIFTAGKQEYLMREFIRAEVVFGTPSKHCAGNGICMLSRAGVMGRNTWINCPWVPVSISFEDACQHLVVQIKTACFLPGMQERYFGGDWFRMEELFSLPLAICSAVEPRRRAVIEAGCYPFCIKNDIIQVTLDLNWHLAKRI